MEITECLPEPRIDLALKMTTDYLRESDLRALAVHQPGEESDRETLLLVIHTRPDVIATLNETLNHILDTIADTP